MCLSPQLAAQQSIDGGVSLPPAEKVDEYARFLADAVRRHLDDEWIPQECHKEIGEEVARLYRAGVDRVSQSVIGSSRSSGVACALFTFFSCISLLWV